VKGNRKNTGIEKHHSSFFVNPHAWALPLQQQPGIGRKSNKMNSLNPARPQLPTSTCKLSYWHSIFFAY
jgi:hypothetical protein